MNHPQTSFRAVRRPNGLLSAGPLIADGERRDQFIRRVVETAPDWLPYGGRVERMRIILLRQGRFEPPFPKHRLPDSLDLVDEEVAGLKQRGRGSPPAASVDDRPAPTHHGGYLASRRLFPEPGHECIVSWEHVGSLLAGQLAHPERLHPSHRLRCRAQVYEATAPHRIEELAAAMLGDPTLGAELHPLTDILAARLGLTVILPARLAAQAPRRNEPGVVIPGDRLVRISIADDPSADEPPPSALPEASGLRGPLPGEAGHRSTIPGRYLRPWELRRSREDAVYDMRVLAHYSWLRRLLRWLHGPRLSRAELLRWEVMLSGKSIEDQLWSVRPPLAGLTHPRVRGWVQAALTSAGYDPGVMMTEWEIYWRRKT
jgi:hypothetical protein